jgi:hypothetical protein
MNRGRSFQLFDHQDAMQLPALTLLSACSSQKRPTAAITGINEKAFQEIA